MVAAGIFLQPLTIMNRLGIFSPVHCMKPSRLRYNLTYATPGQVVRTIGRLAGVLPSSSGSFQR